ERDRAVGARGGRRGPPPPLPHALRVEGARLALLFGGGRDRQRPAVRRPERRGSTGRARLDRARGNPDRGVVHGGRTLRAPRPNGWRRRKSGPGCFLLELAGNLQNPKEKTVALVDADSGL